MDKFDAHKAIEEARERHEHHGPRWIPISAALLAVAAAIASLLSNQHALEALNLKNEAILAQARASDSYNFYESRSIKQHIYESAVAANPAQGPAVRKALTTIAAHEKTGKKPLLKKAQNLELEVTELSRRSAIVMRAHEVLEAAVTLFEVAIAVVSISALTSSTFLTGFGGIAAAFGLFFLIYGLTIR